MVISGDVHAAPTELERIIGGTVKIPTGIADSV
jgi:hypothetical protein